MAIIAVHMCMEDRSHESDLWRSPWVVMQVYVEGEMASTIRSAIGTNYPSPPMMQVTTDEFRLQKSINSNELVKFQLELESLHDYAMPNQRKRQLEPKRLEPKLWQNSIDIFFGDSVSDHKHQAGWPHDKRHNESFAPVSYKSDNKKLINLTNSNAHRDAFTVRLGPQKIRSKIASE